MKKELPSALLEIYSNKIKVWEILKFLQEKSDY